jgi:hypothetical protein
MHAANRKRATGHKSQLAGGLVVGAVPGHFFSIGSYDRMIKWAHGMIVSVAPGSLPRVGKGYALHATSTSFRVLVAGKLHITIRVRRPHERRKYVRRRLAGGRKGVEDDLRAVDQLVWVLADHGELGHGILEGIDHLVLFIDEALPRASRAGVARDEEVGLETQLAHVLARTHRKRGRDLACRFILDVAMGLNR